MLLLGGSCAQSTRDSCLADLDAFTGLGMPYINKCAGEFEGDPEHWEVQPGEGPALCRLVAVTDVVRARHS